MKIVHHMQCRTSQICTCVASSSVIATITLIELFTCQHIQIQRCTFLQEQLSHMRAESEKMSRDTEMLKR